MLTGKSYRFRSISAANEFRNESSANICMVDNINTHGGVFTVKKTQTINGEVFVEEVEFPDGTVLNSDGMGLKYFELYEDEFQFFVEVDTPEKKLVLEVTESNYKEVIKQILDSF